uniref:SRP54-type proteins GTP-binding domain-containing protein n=1 Tax=Ditylum brightwellii TaxID=49249 RepID=A0A6S8YP33_9STRA|mmetsp:Transcript_261/g.394  ORF Transcript_261/g.394 Transcript_261/m.394 type:complete len:547 (-) Transcript_261:376-2016(-)
MLTLHCQDGRRRNQVDNVVAGSLTLLIFLGVCTHWFCQHVNAFIPQPQQHGHRWLPGASLEQRSRETKLSMVFDFFKKRATEGVDQLSDLAKSAAEGKFTEGLGRAANYATQSNKAFAIGLAKSRNKLLYDIDNMLNGGGDILDELEAVLLQSDLGIQTTEEVLEEVKSLREGSLEMFSRDDLRSVLRGKLLEALDTETRTSTSDEPSTSSSRAIKFASPTDDGTHPLTVLFVMGANGMGKTTTIGKLASRLRTEGNQTVLLAACDTFRAGAIEQLEMWADRAQVDCHSPTENQNGPSAVLYGALDRAIRDKYDTLIVDTSGRLSNNDALTAELLKMKRVIQKRMSTEQTEDGKPIFNTNVPHETLLVIDAAQGRMALDSAKQWHKEVGLSGLVLTKLDGSARGGSVVAVSRELDLPVKLIGVGEGIEDLRDFDPETFVDGLLGVGAAGNSKSSQSKSEGKALAERLSVMRKARDDRAKSQQKENKKKNAGLPNIGAGLGGSGMAGEMTLQEMDTPDVEPVMASGGDSGSKAKKKNKKKKKKRAKR